MTATANQPRTDQDLAKHRADFPILSTLARGKPLVYLDNGATTQKPQVVIDVLNQYYAAQNANIHRGVYELSQNATDAYEQARRKVQKFINAAEPAEIIFTRGTTESINLVAHSFGNAFIKSGDEIIISAMEHHSNIVPWQMLCERTGALLKVIPINDAGELDLTAYKEMLSSRTKMVSIVHASNSLGTVNPIAQIIQLAHGAGAKVLVDGAQWVAHHQTDVRAMGADFYAFSGHKLFGPTGIGVLYGRRELLDAMPPFMGGGDMIDTVRFEKTTYAPLPNKFEAGTPHIAGGTGLGAAIDYVQSIGLARIENYEHNLLDYLTQKLQEVPNLRLIGTAREKSGVCSFLMDGLSAHDIGVMLDLEGIACRTGHHCCMPVMERLNIAGTIRASIAFYNTRDDIDRLAAALNKIVATARPKHMAPNPALSLTNLKWPEPAFSSPSESAADLVETFAMFEDWKERYQIIIEMGEKLLPMPAEMKTEATRVHGCQSTVHLFARKRPNTADGLDFLADSDADLVRGLIAVLQKLFAGQSARAIVNFDIEQFFKSVGLDQHLTMGRRNGLAGMVQKIRAYANQLAAASG